MTKIINDYNDGEKLTPEQKDRLQIALEDFRDDVYFVLAKEFPQDDDEIEDPFIETHFDSMVQGYVLAKTGSVALAAWSWCWYSVVVEGRTVPAVLKD